jgi:hypothetical protein
MLSSKAMSGDAEAGSLALRFTSSTADRSRICSSVGSETESEGDAGEEPLISLRV